jgi:hypothetical protein
MPECKKNHDIKRAKSCSEDVRVQIFGTVTYQEIKRRLN